MLELIYTLIVTHVTIVCVTLYLHRGQAHKAIVFHPFLSHMMRFWLWLTTGMKTAEWVAIHRLHHKECEKNKDPHSPHVHGIWRVLFGGALLYHSASKNKSMIDNFSRDIANDWIEKNLYSRYSYLGIVVMLLINLFLFGWIGFLIWLVQIAWIPFWAAGVINGLGHWWGYRNCDTKDKSKNISPIGLIVGGEELHNNHHTDPSDPKLSRRWFEFDIGWGWINIFKTIGLLQVKARKV